MKYVPNGNRFPVIDVDPFSPAILQNPLPFYAMLRDAGPLVWMSEHETYATGQFEATEAILNDSTNFKSAPGIGLVNIQSPGAWREPGGIVEKDAPEHTQIRKTMKQIISPRMVRGWSIMFADVAEKLLASLRAGPPVIDGVEDVAEAFVVKVFPDSLGLDVSRDNLVVFGNHNFNSLGPRNEIFLETLSQVEALSTEFERGQTREALTEGGFGESIFEAQDDGRLPPDSATPILRSFLRGGIDTTISAIGFTLKYFAERPELYEEARRNPGILLGVFEEILRLETPLATFFRTTGSAPVELMGHELAAHTKVQLFPRSANRDPRHWASPESFDHTRKLGQNAAFGLGPHNCLGRSLAQAEADALLQAFIGRVERLEIAGECALRKSNSLHTLEALPLRLTWAS